MLFLRKSFLTFTYVKNCHGSHLGFFIVTITAKLLQDNLMHIIGHGSHFEFSISTKNPNFVKCHLLSISCQVWLPWAMWVWRRNVKRLDNNGQK
jgi:hypothetical protein